MVSAARAIPNIDPSTAGQRWLLVGSFNAGAYYGPDHRHVNTPGVAHAMRCFAAHYLEPQAVEREARNTASPAHASIDAVDELGMVCEDEAIRPTDG